MFAAVDLGSNSFRLHIGKYDGEAIRIIKSARDQIRLAANLDANGDITPQAMEKALESLRGFAKILAEFPLEATRVVATDVFRVAKNSQVFLPLAEVAIGCPIEIISGEEEGRLIYLGVANCLGKPGERRLVIDIGGGSTELILGRGQEVERAESFSIGTGKQSSAFFADGTLTAATFDAALISARSRFEDAAPPFSPNFWKVAYGSSGTIRALSDLIAKNQIGDGSMTRKNLLALQERFIAAGRIDAIALQGLRPDRAPSLVGGIGILLAVMQELDFECVTPIEAGLRMGVMWDLQYRATQRDRREQSVRACMRKFGVDPVRAKRVADEAQALFTQLKPTSDHYFRLLAWSALLHEAGLVVSQTDYHKHSAYLVENVDLPGFTTREQKLMGKLVLGQKGNLRKLAEALPEPDFAKAVLALRIAIVFMHSRIEIDFSELRLRLKTRIELEIPRRYTEDHPTLAYWFDKEREAWAVMGLDFALKLS